MSRLFTLAVGRVVGVAGSEGTTIYSVAAAASIGRQLREQTRNEGRGEKETQTPESGEVDPGSGVEKTRCQKAYLDITVIFASNTTNT